MVCSPASSEIATNGMPRQILAAISEKRAGQGLPRKSTLVERTCSTSTRKYEMIENCGSEIHQNASADNTVGTIQGNSTMARSRLLNGKWLFSNSASQKPSA